MTISNVSIPTTSSSSSASANDTAALSNNYQMFIQLLVTQLQNQNPLDPTDTTQFTNQLVQYSSVEQQIKMNSTLADLKTMFAVQNAMSFVSYVGKTVTVDSSTTDFTDGKATWNFNGTAACDKATIKVLDADGNVVYETTEKLAAGDGKFVWNGETTDGTTAAGGTYTISISGKDSAGKSITYKSETTGVVASVDFSGSTPMLSINGQMVSAYLVKAVKPTS
jgi:flagellar basal-body rod modification protein FlgD